MIKVQQSNFVVADEYLNLANDNQDGAVVTFVGKVRDFNEGIDVQGLSLEHYPGMTEKVLSDIENKAREHWPLNKVTIIHRFGDLKLGEQIVFIGVTSPHRKAAFAACEFLIDFLKTQAPFWKKELTSKGSVWLDAKNSDDDASQQWQEKLSD
ncbi:molybdopterin synthase catalytic subunit MoaE [Colwellia sp. M166]|uniref:molybdopterin synthase catalytic subunit MoaE n=1 Tax=Colwellia sp. M166 TaxID=2583805 RepID=UPI00211ED0F8|nr:molybdopterin synthase catalytic subunit MoaE [Colwellia sp. M166]UUO25181.1 molybdopterin synthase catalytic subunit MoaE [Colwellia sp. M166]|tara:strand:- start:10879 stop:11337 length:459 start_codon:yes stop_codon:yes gene_type:complete